MSQILLAWELGLGYGHIARLSALGQELARRGHEATFALRDVSRAEWIIGRYGHRIVQAPIWLPPAHGLRTPLSFADILARFGYLDPQGLLGVAKAWRELFSMVRPDLLIADFAPTALLASIGLRFPRAQIGTGFASPPGLSPLPAMRWWQKGKQRDLEAGEAPVLNTINRVLKDLEATPLKNLAELLAVDADFLCGLEELDYYPQRTGARYWGPIVETSGGLCADWPNGEGIRVFAYLRPEFKGFERIVKVLKSRSFRVLAHVPNLSPGLASRLSDSRMKFSAAPLQVSHMAETCDLAVCHSPGTASTMLLAGKPVLLLALHLEQYLFGRRMQDVGAGIVVSPDLKSPDYGALLRKIVSRPEFAESARGFSERHGTPSSASSLGGIADRCEELLASQ